MASNILSKREMESLAAACNTLLPRMDVSDDTEDEALLSFYGTSPSMAGTPHVIGCLVSGGLQHPAIGMIRVALWLLSTGLGTMLMCGRRCLSSQFPYINRFSELSQEKREEIMLSWSLSYFYLFRMLFKCIKYLTMRHFFGQVNEEGDNPSWKAMGYCGPDPTFVVSSKTAENREDDSTGALHSALIPSPMDPISLSMALHKAGFPPSSLSPLSLRCDAVIVGSGSGGSVVAGVLATAGYKVLVVEKGDYYPRDRLSLLEGPTCEAMYEGGGLIASDDLGVLLLAGSTVGGGSTINWSASIRTPDHVRREWGDLHGLDLFGSHEFDRALDVVCERMGVQCAVDVEGFNNAVLRRGCVELGFPVSDVPCNAPPDHYCGWCHLGCKDGKKKGTQETWLADMAASGNGLILTGCKAMKVLYDEKTRMAKGVLISNCNYSFVVKSKVTVIACGALNTPSLLKRSGLRNPNIGKHLHLHPAVMAWGYFPETANGWPEEGKRSYEGAILTAMSTVVSEFQGSGYGAILQTPALHPGMFSILTPWVSAHDFRKRITRFARTTHIYTLARDRGAGVVDYPNQLSYHLDPRDERSLSKGVEKMLRILVAAGAEEIGTHHGNGEKLRVSKGDDQGLERFVKRASTGITKSAPICSAHQMGSCRMGTSPRASAVRPSGETWEVEGLFVTDTSVFPTALGVNPMVTVQAIAYCTAQSILDHLRNKS